MYNVLSCNILAYYLLMYCIILYYRQINTNYIYILLHKQTKSSLLCEFHLYTCLINSNYTESVFSGREPVAEVGRWIVRRSEVDLKRFSGLKACILWQRPLRLV